ncbi:YceI family protein [Sphingomonas crocodyli]|uniref:Polyisoprenoid-binding protein n=1 Tax=Sphingomonas crocodyli TaxID=1979270 RepID=A0A437M9E0_9SPHN|nr:YceI family protein [Sphingomonas crocodyli]RVT94259.1 polyisoprenoid-binding protein [Sphingomonas crocodyli]
MKKAPLLLAALLASAAALPVIAQDMPKEAPGAPDPARITGGTYKADPYHTQVGFDVLHLGFSQYRGLIGDITGTLTLDPKKPAAAKVSIDIPLEGIKTTSADLDKHLKAADFFDATKFPTAHFESTSVKVNGTKAVIAGNLTIKGVTKPVVLDTKFVGAGKMFNPMTKATTEQVGFEATTTIKRSDFGVSYGVPLVPDAVPLTISVAFEKPA